MESTVHLCTIQAWYALVRLPHFNAWFTEDIANPHNIFYRII